MRLGLPGQDTYTPGEIVDEGDGWSARRGSGYSFANVQFEPDHRGPFMCGVCLGTGWRTVKPEREPPAYVYVHSPKADRMSVEEIITKMQLEGAGIIDRDR